MLKIAVPLASMRTPEGARIAVEFSRETYPIKMVAFGLTPIFLSAHLSKKAVDELYAECRGVLLMGGGDVDPARYGVQNHPKNRLESPLRDELELTLAQRALADKKPLLGICRGAQVLNVAVGGTLIQHLPDVVSGEKHGVTEGGTYDELLSPANGHDIILKAGTRARQMIGKDKIHVNSAHHQAVDKLGRGLLAAGTSPAGVIEVLEHEDANYFCFGLQSHPECCGIGENDVHELDMFFGGFARAVQRS